MGVKDAVPSLQLVTVASPAAGADFHIIAPGIGLWRVLSLAFTFTTSANVGNRTIVLTADDGTNVWFRSAPASQQGAGSTVKHGAFSGAPTGGISTVAIRLALPADGVWLHPGWRLNTETDAIDAADQFSAIAAYVEEYPTGPGIEWLPTTDRALYERS